jgi:quercetin dioxygenase-like cupin family protein
MFNTHSKMTKFVSVAVLLTALSLNAQVETQAQEQPKKTAAKKTATAEAFIGTPDKIKWSPFAPGVEFGPVYGNCDKPGAPCVFQLRLAAGAKIPPHWHPVDENVTVLSGTFMAGMGDILAESKLLSLAPGSYVLMPRRMHHFAMAKTAALVQVHGVGPFKINYVNAADDPAKSGKSGD